jgi:hypothetical protein
MTCTNILQTDKKCGYEFCWDCENKWKMFGCTCSRINNNITHNGILVILSLPPLKKSYNIC